jgi:quercetin dioxygenase-like cupin family protein
MRVIKPESQKPTKMTGEIFVGEVEGFTAVGAEHAHDFRLSQIRFRSGARNRWHVHPTDQILMCTEGDGVVATEAEQHDLVPGVIVLIPANTRHWHGAKPGKDMTHWAILGRGETKITD